jgi:putative Holliday junction resolvase
MEGRIMALDYGLNRIGVAMTDLLRITAKPFDTIECMSHKEDIKKIVKTAIDNNVSEIVVGLPINMDGTEGDMAKAVRKFVEKLGMITDLPIAMVDESLSTVEAFEVLSQKGIKFNYKDKGLKDRIAAALILERYLVKKCAI